MLTPLLNIHSRVRSAWLARLLPVVLAGCGGSAGDAGTLPGMKGMVGIPAGEFIMGSDRVDDEDLQSRYGFTRPLFVNEHPEHRVHLDAYYIDKYEVTNAEYKEFVLATGYPEPASWIQNAYNVADRKLETAHVDNLRWIATDYFNLDRDTRKMDKKALVKALLEIQRRRDRLPVTAVSWYDAYNYCDWRDKRLPTEAEWEKAARGTRGSEFPWGDEWSPDKVNTGDQMDGEEVLVPPGSYAGDVSVYGVYDLGGNVAEWTADWYGPYPGSEIEDEDFGERHRVVRGGGAGLGHYALSVFFRSARRAHTGPDAVGTDVGFRCARSAGGG